MDIVELSALLWRERTCLELVVFKLEEQRLLLQAGQSRWLQRAEREADVAWQRLRETRLARVAGTASIARHWRMPAGTGLTDLAVSAPIESWRDILSAHLQAIRDLEGQLHGLEPARQSALDFTDNTASPIHDFAIRCTNYADHEGRFE